MKVILSRKGFDGTYGGCPSPILPDGTMVSMPIPGEGDMYKYKDLQFPGGGTYLDIWNDLKPRGNKVLTCHLDPDIRKGIRSENVGWKPTFGQCDAAQGHLLNQGVGEDDVFLFFGWFRKVEYVAGHWRYIKEAPRVHAIYGYMQVDHILTGEDVKKCPWHPHSRYSNTNNAIYVATDMLRIDEKGLNLPGAGVLTYSEDLVLTAPGRSHSRWKLIDVLANKNIELSYHDKEKCIKDGYFQSAARGQEFVFEKSPVVNEWTEKLLVNNCTNDLRL